MPKRTFFSQPYSFSQAVLWLLHNLFGPSKRYRGHTKFAPQRIRLNEIVPRTKLAFVGDILPFQHADLVVDPEIRKFVADADYLVGNFEGTIPNGRPAPVLTGQIHSAQVLDHLARVFPPGRTLLNCSNNHTGDYGESHFQHSCEVLQRHGFTTFGTLARPSITLDSGVKVASGTQWSNQPCDYVVWLDRAASDHDGTAEFTILYPHWGFEMQLYPSPKQIQNASELLERWDMIVGHHSHCPQPVAVHNGRKSKQLVAYSLGDLVFSYNIHKYLYGVLLRVELGPGADGRWQAGEVSWAFTRLTFSRGHPPELATVDSCPYFD